MSQNSGEQLNAAREKFLRPLDLPKTRTRFISWNKGQPIGRMNVSTEFFIHKELQST